jgi:DNA-binding NarL/FixJ family response regulator
MKPLSVVVYQYNLESAESLAKCLYTHFRVVNVARDLDDLRRAIPRHSADVAIVDMERTALEEIQQLRKEFAATSIVCIHRLADERLWTQALAAGAIDCCASSDVRAIVLAASNTTVVSHSHAA